MQTVDISALVLGSLALLLYGALAVRWHCVSPRSCWRGLARSFAEVRSSLVLEYLHAVAGPCPRKLGGDAAEHGGEAGSMATLITDMVHQRRVRFFTASEGIILTAMAAMQARSTWVILATGERWASTPLSFLFISYFIFLSFHHYYARSDGLFRMRLMLIATMLFLGTAELVGWSEMHVLVFSHFALIAPVRLLISVFWMETWITTPMNCMISCMFGVAVHRAQTEMEGVTRVHLMIAETFAVLTIHACARAFQEVIVMLCQHTVELKASKSESCATVTVLNAMCDAVVQLDEGQRMVGHETKLAALLLHGQGRCLAGSDFLQYLYGEDDRIPCRQWLGTAPVQYDLRTGFESRLRDSTGNAIAVEMFNVPFETVNGAVHNFVGIREKNIDILPPPPDSVDVQPLDAGSFATGATSESTSPRANPSIEEIGGIHEVDGCPVFTFDFGTLKVCGHSRGFSIGACSPPRTGSSLRDQLKRCPANIVFFDKYMEIGVKMLQLARTTPGPVELEYTTPMSFSPRGGTGKHHMDLKIFLAGSWPPGADHQDVTQLPKVMATAVVRSVTHEDRLDAMSTSRRPRQARTQPARVSL